jgi:hypothetical protein
MALSRRGFLGLTAAAVAAYALDPERLLWVPGAKTIFLPPTTVLAAERDEVECLIAGLGGPFLVGYQRGSDQRTTVMWGNPSDPTAVMKHLSDQEYRLLVDRGRKILAYRKTVVGVTEPELQGYISKAEAAERWPAPPHDPRWR